MPEPVGSVSGVVVTSVYDEVLEERLRAHAKHAPNGSSMEGRHYAHASWLAVLVEEVGEVGRALCEGLYLRVNPTRLRGELRSELVQVAAMATAWVDAIDRWEEES